MEEINKATYPINVPEDRKQLLNYIKDSEKPIKILLIGGVDTGKTTLATYLINELLKSDTKVAVIDSDVGQKSILPPATISLSVPKTPVNSLHELTQDVGYFIGSTTPIQFFGEMITGTKLLSEYIESKVDVTIIDTTGLISESGSDLKRMKIEIIKPDLIVALQKNNELRSILRPFELKKDIKIFYLDVYENIRSFNREKRKKIREEKWREYFKDHFIYNVKFTEVFISGSKLFQGDEILENEKYLLESLFKWKILYGRKCEGKYTIVKRDLISMPRQIDKNILYYIDPERFHNLIVGLINKDGFCLGLGVLSNIDFENETLTLITPIKKEEFINVNEIRFGRVKINENGKELGILDRNII